MWRNGLEMIVSKVKLLYISNLFSARVVPAKREDLKYFLIDLIAI